MSQLKLLIVSREERSRSFSTLFDGISKAFDCTVIKLTKMQIKDFANTVEALSCEDYDRVMFDVPLRRIGKNYTVLKKIKGLILYEEDAYQEFVKRSEYYKKYSKIYKDIGACRLILTGYNVGSKFESMGLDVKVIPKAYDENHLRDLGGERDINLGFVGRVKNKIYKPRQAFLQSMIDTKGALLFKTDPGDEYLQALNRIKIFLSADIGLLEYMAKNFEAMACGCVVLAKRQGGIEEESLGLKHMENVVLYDDYDDAKESLERLERDESLVARIQRQGLQFVQKKHTLGDRVTPFVCAIEPSVNQLSPAAEGSLFERLKFWR